MAWWLLACATTTADTATNGNTAGDRPRAASPATRIGTANGEWLYYGGDAGGSRYSPLGQIDASNVSRLQIAWRWSSAALGQEKVDSYLRTTPLEIDGVLYLTAGDIRSVVALDAATGQQRWVFTPEEDATAGRSRGGSGRGVAYWKSGDSERLFFVSRSFRLFSLDPKTGLPDPTFGTGGEVDLREGLGPRATPDSGDFDVAADRGGGRRRRRLDLPLLDHAQGGPARRRTRARSAHRQKAVDLPRHPASG